MILGFFKYLFFTLVAIVGVSTASLYLVWNNSYVTQQVLTIVKDKVPGLSWDKAEGTLSTGITFTNLRFVTEHYGYSAGLDSSAKPKEPTSIPTLVDVTIPYVTTHVNFNCLVTGQVCLDYFHAKDPYVIVAIGNDHKFDKFGKDAYKQITLADLLPHKIEEDKDTGGGYPKWLVINGNDVQITDLNVIIGDNIGLAQYNLNQQLLANQKNLFPYQISEQMRTGNIVLNGKTLPSSMRYVATLNNFALEHLPFTDYNKYVTKPMIIRLGEIFANHFSYSKDKFNKVVLDNAHSTNVHLLITEEKTTQQILAQQEQESKARLEEEKKLQPQNLVIYFYDKHGKSIPYVVKSNLIPDSLKSIFSEYFYIHDQGVSPSYVQLTKSLSSQHQNSVHYLVNSALSDISKIVTDQSEDLHQAFTSNSKSFSNKAQSPAKTQAQVKTDSATGKSSSASANTYPNFVVNEADKLGLDTSNLLVIQPTLKGKQNATAKIISTINSNLEPFRQPASQFLLAKENRLELPLILNTKNVHITGVSLNFVNYNSQQYLIDSVNYDLSDHKPLVRPVSTINPHNTNQVSIIDTSKTSINRTNHSINRSHSTNLINANLSSNDLGMMATSNYALPNNFDLVSAFVGIAYADNANDSKVNPTKLSLSSLIDNSHKPTSSSTTTNPNAKTSNTATSTSSNTSATASSTSPIQPVKLSNLSELAPTTVTFSGTDAHKDSNYRNYQSTGVYPVDKREVINDFVKEERQFSILPSNFQPIPGFIDLTPIDSFNLTSLDVDGNLHPKSSNLVVVSHGDVDANLSIDYDSNSTLLNTSAQVQINKLPYVRLPLQVNLNLGVYGKLNHSLLITAQNQGYNANAVVQLKLITNKPNWPLDLKLQLDSFRFKELTLNPVYITAHGQIDNLKVKVGAGVVTNDTPFAVLANIEQQAGKVSYDLKLASNSKVYTRFSANDLIKMLSQGYQLYPNATATGTDTSPTPITSNQLTTTHLSKAAQAYFHKRADQDMVIVPIDALNRVDFNEQSLGQNQVMQVNLSGALTYQDFLGVNTQLSLQDLHITKFVQIPNVTQLISNGHLELSVIYNSQQDWSLLIHDWNLNGRLNQQNFVLNSDISLDSVAGLHINNLVIDYLTNHVKAVGKANSNLKLNLVSNINDLSTLVPNLKINASSNLQVNATPNRQDLKGFIKIPLLELTKAQPSNKINNALNKINQQLRDTARALALSLPELNLGTNLGSFQNLNLSDNSANNATSLSSDKPSATVQSSSKTTQNSANSNATSTSPLLVHMTNVTANLDLNYINDIGGKAKINLGPSTFSGFKMDASTITFVDKPHNHLDIEFNSSVTNVKASLDKLSIKRDQPIVADLAIDDVDVFAGHLTNLHTLAPFHVTYNLKTQTAKVSPFTLVNPDLNLSLVNNLTYTPQRVTGKFTLNQFDLKYINNYTKDVDLSLAGKVNGTINLDLDPTNIQLASNTVKVQLNTPLIKLSQSLNEQKDLNLDIKKLSLGVNLAGANLSVANSMIVQGSPLAINANISNYLDAGDLSGTVKLSQLSLKVIKPFLENDQKIDGDVSANLRLGGNIRKPLLFGTANINNLDVDMVDLPFEVRKGNLTTTFNGDNATLSGNLATDSTPIVLSGTANWQDLSNLTSQVNVKTKDLQLKILDYTRAKLDSNVSATYSAQNIVVRGDAIVHDSLISISNIDLGYDSPSDDVVLINNNNIPLEPPVHSDALQKLDVVLNAKIGKNVVFNSYGVDASLAGGVTIHYQQAKLGILGTITIPQGTFEQYGQNLIVKKGDITFNGINIIPNIDIKAIRNPAFMNDTSVTVGVQASGPATKPTISLFSTPALPESQKINYLLTGSPSDSEGGVGLQLFTSSLTSSLSVVEKIGEAFGIKNLQFSTAKSGEDSQLTLSGTVFKKLRLNYAFGLFNGLTELSASYRLLPRIFIQISHGLSDAIDAVYNISW